ncbi:MAG: hypothetical protein CR988_06890 [Treponema sp.]|nr:MAG: hypothetical protein CR988_06890 [Treponema sp.]
MTFEMPKFNRPDFSDVKFTNAENVKTETVEKDGVAPDGFYLTSHLPTYFKYNGSWILPARNSLNCVATLHNSQIQVKELRDLKQGEHVVLATKDDASEGVFKVENPFGHVSVSKKAVETSFSNDYEFLYRLMEHEKKSGGYIVWVLGPSVVFDHDTRIALSDLATAGYVNGLMAGNAMATHDLEGGYLNTALGQNIYTQESVPMGHYNHLDLLNEVRRAGSIDNFISQGHVKNGFMKKITELGIPYVLAGSIRDDGPLPEVYQTATGALEAMKDMTNKATLIICLATLLHSVSTANLASSYRVTETAEVVPVYLYSVDVTENVTHKISAARENIAVKTVVTNVQDFVVNIQKALIQGKRG